MLAVLFSATANGADGAATDSSDERAAVAAADRAYAQAWLSNDPDRVMATLGPQPIMVPSGMDPIAGRQAIRRFWFPPDSPATMVSRFELEQAEVAVEGDLAYARGAFELSFTVGDDAYDSAGTYLTILRRQQDGGWLISRRTWNDHRRTQTD